MALKGSWVPGLLVPKAKPREYEPLGVLETVSLAAPTPMEPTCPLVVRIVCH